MTSRSFPRIRSRFYFSVAFAFRNHYIVLFVLIFTNFILFCSNSFKEVKSTHNKKHFYLLYHGLLNSLVVRDYTHGILIKRSLFCFHYHVESILYGDMAVKVEEEDLKCVLQRKNVYSRGVFASASASASLPLPQPVSRFACNSRTRFATLFKNSLFEIFGMKIKYHTGNKWNIFWW